MEKHECLTRSHVVASVMLLPPSPSLTQERLNLTVIWLLVNIAFIFFFFIGVMSYLALGQWAIAVGYILALFFHLYASIIVFSYAHNLFILQTVRDLIPYPIIHSNPDLQDIEHHEPQGKRRPPKTPCPSPRMGPGTPPPHPASQEVVARCAPASPLTPPRRRLPPPERTVFPKVKVPKPRPLHEPVQVQAQVRARAPHSHIITLQT
ncbi:uncharacterized protein [Panulirus ornatus]|uniref:uncharacterized protein n=1 Tax=Panulirus ornatus TaxID=150431 RepID=UPI003A8B3A49